MTYLNGLREGEEKLISDENVLFANKHYKQGLLDGQSIWYSAQDVASGIRHYRKGEYHGMQAIFDPNHNHRLMELSHYEYDETLPVKPSQDECIMRENPYSNDCKDILNPPLEIRHRLSMGNNIIMIVKENYTNFLTTIMATSSKNMNSMKRDMSKSCKIMNRGKTVKSASATRRMAVIHCPITATMSNVAGHMKSITRIDYCP